MPELYVQVHRQYHITFPDMPHSEEGMHEYLRGFLHGVRFGVEYPKWARAIEAICYHTEGVERLNPPYGVDDTARWMMDSFGPGALQGEDLVNRLERLRAVLDYGSAEQVMPGIDKDGNIEWLPGKPTPTEWWNEWNEV